jgi:hypothetical protein
VVSYAIIFRRSRADVMKEVMGFEILVNRFASDKKRKKRDWFEYLLIASPAMRNEFRIVSRAQFTGGT